ncbi:MAG: excinuclease ABC subunit UvrB [Candidatus Saccharibacteria bacterium]|nr:excinuclease ABC subunit UvrB [Candidatus Saccharibacteria bacterium]
MSRFKLVSKYQPTGDQPNAIRQLVDGLDRGEKCQTLLGVTGSGKTFTMANIIAETQRPTLILAHNKTLAAQLYAEFRDFFPENEVHYFVSYFDYYQPEAYIASTDTYIEKDSAINDEIDRLRHGATEALLSRRDVIVVSSVSCIYGIGSPENYLAMSFSVRASDNSSSDTLKAVRPSLWSEKELSDLTQAELSDISQDELIRKLVSIQYHRNDLAFERGNFRVMGDTVDLYPANGENGYRFEFEFDRLETIKIVDPLTFEVKQQPEKVHIFPNTHYATPREDLERALKSIRAEYAERLAYFNEHEKFLEAQRLSQRIKYDLEMLEQTGFVKGIENYSRHLEGRKPGEPPHTLLDFFPKDFLLIVDESHMTLPQVRGMYNGDHARKLNLVDYGFRLPSALDNRPLTFGEFDAKVGQAIYVSATPGEYELENSPKPAEQVIRPTGLLDPEIEVRKTDGQIDNLMEEIDRRIAKGQRTLITTLTKRMAEDLTDHLKERDVKTAYIHSDIDTLERGDILKDLREGVVDVLVGINLLREGLDLPEVSLVAILDADKEGFLRSESALIQTIGRAARHVEGKVIMYADYITESMEKAITETNRRREIQKEYNAKHHIVPTSIKKEVSLGLRAIIPEKEVEDKLDIKRIPKDELPGLIKSLQSEMQLAAANLEFEKAATLRDEIEKIKSEL